MTKECPDCQRNKFSRHKPYRELQPVKTLSRSWEVILQDFITKLSKSKDPVTEQEHNAVLVIIDRLTKWGYFIAYTEEISVENITQIYVKEVFL